MNDPLFKKLTDFLVALGIDEIGHSQKSYLAHLVALHRFMEAEGGSVELCRAGMFHSIYGTEQFQGFKLPIDRRGEIRELIGERAERLGYLNCAMDRSTFYRASEQQAEPFRFRDRLTGEGVELSREDFDDLCRVHLYDWLEQVPRSRFGWGHRRQEYRRLAERLGNPALATYDRLFALEPTSAVP